MNRFDFIYQFGGISSIGLVILFIVVLFLIFIILQHLNQKRIIDKIDNLHLKIKEDIKFSVAPKSIALSLGVNELVDVAVEIWRMEQRISKSASNLPEKQLKGLENSIQKLRRYLEKYDIEIIDHKNVKYNDGLNLDILSTEIDPSISESIIKETIEPTIICKGQVVRKAKIILISNH